MSRSQARRLAIAVVAGCVAFQSVSASAQVPPDPVAAVPAELLATISEAEMQDLTLLADQNGEPLEEVIARYAWNDDFSQAVAEIRDQHPGTFSGAEIVDAGTAWVAFSGSPPAGVRDHLAGLARMAPSVDVEVRGGRGYSERGLEAAVESAHFAVYRSAGVRDAATTFDEETRTITTDVVLVGGEQDSVLAALNARAREALAAAGQGEARGLTASVRHARGTVLGGVDSSSYHYGGEDITGCTSGFGTTNSSGTRGISTAGHCDNTQSDDGYSLSYQRGHQGTHGDFQWHIGSRVESDDFYAGSSTTTETSLRDVSAVGSPTVGQSLCKNGVTNHASCQQVRKLGVCNGSACNLVEMGARLAAGGDSGGPIYWGYTAYGLHQGWIYDPAWPYDRDTFSRADRIDDALGIRIATS